jgi:hypothetical protein
MQRLLLVISILLILTPALVLADASVVQDSCLAVGTPPNANVWTYFTIVNFSLPAPVCDLHLIPEPFPASAGCEILDTINAPGWSSVLDPGGGATFFANTPGDCVPIGGSKGGFAFYLDPDFCCYVVQFTDATGAVILEQEECFTCQKIPTQEQSWGAIKQLYH